MSDKLIKDYEGKLVKDPVDRGLGTMPIGALLFKMSAPMVISMFVQACYNVVDSIFVARISEAALSALSLAFPVQFFIVAINIGTNIGMTAMISRSLGERRFENASAYAKHSLFLSIIYSIIFALLGLCFTKPYFAFQTFDQEIIENGYSYLHIILMCSFGTFFQIPFEKMLQATGRSTESMITQLTGAIFNIIFDPILIFGLFGFPRLGIEGAAIATVAGQTLGAVVGYILNKVKNKSINLDLLNFKLRPDMIANIYRIGVPTMIMDTVGCFMILLFNKIIIKYPQAVAIVGIYYKMESFVFMPLFGLNNGMVPIVSYNYGSHNKDRIIKVLRCALISAITLMTIGTIIFL
ncbi:MAG: MATE family efflux transporter, partial [Clostridia bacterium]|nr:MATE family efflux transporter [Clostridia bacterium]